MNVYLFATLDTKGAEAVVIGRSMMVGKPMAMLLVAKGSDSTVTAAEALPAASTVNTE